MMNDSSLPPENSELDPYLDTYREALAQLATTEQLSARQLLRLLRSRDRIQERFIQTQEISDDALEKLLELDLDLKHNAILICQAEHLEQLRQNLEPPAAHWWWYLEPYTEDSTPPLPYDRFDWLWNFGTVVCIVIATSLMTQTAQSFSVDGFDFPGLLSTITQGTGLVFIAGGALTDRGKQVVSQILTSLKIPSFFHAEVTFAASLILLGSIYGINQNLYLIGNWYFEQGQYHESRREFSQAFQAYKRAQNFSPDDYKIQLTIGFLHEKLGDFEKATEIYQMGTSFGIPEFLNAQARAIIMGTFQQSNWEGGVDPVVIREAEDLLDRAEKSIVNYENQLEQTVQNPRLKQDIQINKSLAKMSLIPGNSDLSDDTKAALNEVAESLEAIRSSSALSGPREARIQSAMTDASTLGELRADCFYQKAFSIGFQVNSPIIYGIDDFIKTHEQVNACWPFSVDSRLSTTSDALLLKNYRFFDPSSLLQFGLQNIEEIQSFSYFIHNFPSEYENLMQGKSEISNHATKISLIQDPQTWLTLAEGLSRKIQEDFSQNLDPSVNPRNVKKQDQIIWRFLLNRQGEVMAYFAYDDVSRMVERRLPFAPQALQLTAIEQSKSALAKGGALEFADFKVVLATDGQILHLLPWQMAYTTGAEQCRDICKQLILNPRVRAAFKGYNPDLRNGAELAALQSVVLTNMAYLAIDNRSGVYSQDPAIFKLRVSADGQVVSHRATNPVALQKYGEGFPLSNLESIQFSELERSPYADFRMEVRGLIYDIKPWEE
ncbi:MAG: tetratricopeptide repeat protein [Cyanobacteria bacterium]|nr:tetratricopeptide repeat protein [Cyanobacteriota bacterium]